MAVILPFRALRPRAEFVSRLASRPYDVLSGEEARQEAMDNQYSFYHISRSEIDLPPGTDPHSPAVYEKASENLERFIRQGILLKEESACFYIYELTMDSKVQTGLVGVSSLDDYDQGIIKKHELTRPDKELDRICHIRATGAQTGNVFLAYNDHEGIDRLVSGWTAAHAPVYDFRAPDGIQHRLWVVDEKDTTGKISGLFHREIPITYIADGHHRAASASLVRRDMAGEGKVSTDHDPVNFFLTTLFPASQLTILEYNRVVKDLNNLSPPEFLNRLSAAFLVSAGGKSPVIPAAPHEFGMYLDQQWWRLQARPGSFPESPAGELDVTILQEIVLAGILDIRDPRTDPRLDFIGGIRGAEELEKRVESGEMQVAFRLFPVTAGQLFRMADSGRIMPPKSTWFEPKLRDGLVTHCIR